MRQIYNIGSSPTQFESNISPFNDINNSVLVDDGSSTTSNCTQHSLFKYPFTSTLANNTNNNHNNVQMTTDTTDDYKSIAMGSQANGDLFKCLTSCANASRLSLANLLPSRFDYT